MRSLSILPYLLSMVFKHIGLMDNIVMAWSYPIIVAFSSLLLAMIIYRFKILNCSVGKRKREEIDA